jgi:type II secretory pathway pseudopilin PulG
MQCPRCRFDNPEGTRFCASCGAPMGVPARPSTASATTPSEQPRQGMAIASLVLGLLSLPLMCAFGAGLLTAIVGLILGIVALVRSNRAPAEHGGKGLAIGGIAASAVCFLTVPIIAAIAIPSLLRARTSANESAAIGDVRTVISAQAAYQSANGGYYASTLDCLVAPTSPGCIPSYPATGPTFIDPSLATTGPKSGYLRSFVAIPAPPDVDPKLVGRNSAASFLYGAVPAKPGNTGIRGFLGDASGMICYSTDGSMPSADLQKGAIAPGASCNALY